MLLNKSRIESLSFYPLLLFLLLVIAFPNALRSLKFGLLCLAVFFFLNAWRNLSKEACCLLLAGSLVSLLYLIKGVLSGYASIDLVVQVFSIYIIAPVFWILIFSYIFKEFSYESVGVVMLWFSVVSALTVFFYYAAFLSGHSYLIQFMIDEPNVTISDSGVPAANMHVFGSLIFVVAGFIALVWIRLTKIYVCMAFLFLFVVLISGRSALLLSILVGIFIFLSVRVTRYGIEKKMINMFLLMIIGLIGIWGLGTIIGIDVGGVFYQLINKASAGSGDERFEQFSYLLDGVVDNLMLGSGHGVGVEYIRNEEYVWRYELLLLATLHKVGLAGLFIYALPFILSVYRFFILLKRRQDTHWDYFYFLGMVAIVISCNTNPYLESIEFQWMYFLPYAYFCSRFHTKTDFKVM